jgi:hypothetical protein
MKKNSKLKSLNFENLVLELSLDVTQLQNLFFGVTFVLHL